MIAKVFKSGNSQAVRLPKEFRFNVSEVEIFRRGDEIILKQRAPNLVKAFDLLCELDAYECFSPDERKDEQPQERESF